MLVPEEEGRSVAGSGLRADVSRSLTGLRCQADWSFVPERRRGPRSQVRGIQMPQSRLLPSPTRVRAARLDGAYGARCLIPPTVQGPPLVRRRAAVLPHRAYDCVAAAERLDCPGEREHVAPMAVRRKQWSQGRIFGHPKRLLKISEARRYHGGGDVVLDQHSRVSSRN
jgi:hypothetical protein